MPDKPLSFPTHRVAPEPPPDGPTHAARKPQNIAQFNDSPTQIERRYQDVGSLLTRVDFAERARAIYRMGLTDPKALKQADALVRELRAAVSEEVWEERKRA